MIPRFTDPEFDLAKSRTKLPLECVQCGCIFYRSKKFIKECYDSRRRETGKSCSKHCDAVARRVAKGIEWREVSCFQCYAVVTKRPCEIKSGRKDFCNRSCRTLYQNSHKTQGIRRSKLEVYLETSLIKLFPCLELHFNRKDVILSELDIFIPALNLAVEVNGILHYKPIYGDVKLLKIKENDYYKSRACLERGIKLHVVDTYLKSSTPESYLCEVTEVIKRRIDELNTVAS